MSFARGRPGWVSRLRSCWETQMWLTERRQLAMRPWEEDLLHWSLDGGDWVLHGHLTPPPGRRRSVTSDGWCPMQRSAARAPRSPGGLD
jgi:hypothetical protein